MAYIYHETINNASLPSQQATICGQKFDPSTTGVVTYRKYMKVLSRESRPRPKVLRKAMTSRAEQSTTVSHHGESKFEQLIPDYWCPDGQTKGLLVREQWLYPERNINDHAADPFIDWVTPARLAIKGQTVSLGQDLAEYRQTVKMFGDTGAAIRRGWQSYRKARRGNWKDLMCDVAAADIIHGFGIAPFMGVLDDSLEALATRLDDEYIIPIYVKRSATNRSTVEVNGRTEKSRTRSTVKVKIYVEFEAQRPTFQPSNVFHLGWELVPFSFLWDYMMPLGAMLDSLDALKFVKGMTGTVSRKDVSNTSSEWIVPPSGYTLVSSRPAITTHKRHHRNVIDATLPIAPYPRWRPSASWVKLRHSIALLASAQPECSGRRRQTGKPLKRWHKNA